MSSYDSDMDWLLMKLKIAKFELEICKHHFSASVKRCHQAEKKLAEQIEENDQMCIQLQAYREGRMYKEV